MDKIMNDLMCPISMEILKDPVTVPCCGKAFSRASLVGCFQATTNLTCPTCNADLSHFDVSTAPKNVVLAGIIESLNLEGPSVAEMIVDQTHVWQGELHPINSSREIAELSIKIAKSQFSTRPSLFIAVVDRSGSMHGRPLEQVETALVHMMAITQRNPLIKTVIIPYDSTAEIVEFERDSTDLYIRNGIKTMLAKSGGTNFLEAFTKLKQVLSLFTCDDSTTRNNVSSVTVAFLTDGQDGSFTGKNNDEAKAKLIGYLREIIVTWSGPISIHSVGFGGGCDISFLETVFTCGKQPGTFRYAEPTDGDDTLCTKLQGIFEIVTKGTTVPITINLTGMSCLDGSSTMELQLPIDEYHNGNYNLWVRCHNTNYSIEIDSALDTKVRVPISVKSVPNTLDKWISQVTDDLATELVMLVKNKSGQLSFQLHSALFKQKLNTMDSLTTNESVKGRLNYLKEELRNLDEGTVVNLGKLNDIRFSSKYGTSIVKAPTKQEKVAILEKLQEPPKPKEYKELYVYYSRNNRGADRNPLQEAIVDTYTIQLTEPLHQLLNTITYKDVIYKDINGNNALHLAAYCGLPIVIEILLNRFPEIPINEFNNGNETALTLSIKKHGYWKSMNLLLKHGALIPEGRKSSLEQYACDNGYRLTAEILSNIGGELVKVATPTMKPGYIEFMYYLAIEKGQVLDYDSYLQAALAHGMLELSTTLLETHHLKPTLQMLFDYAIPPKADDPETDKYLELTKLLLKYNNDLINAQDPTTTLETPLFKACERGSLPHVQYFLSEGACIDLPNNLGNSPLWIACFKRYPCIAGELLKHGASVNLCNHKGNPPLYGICQKGPLKMAEMLVSSGASVDLLNENKDNLLLISCRNGQSELVAYFLNLVDPNFVNYQAPIDGFNALFASVESDRADCIKVLAEYGVDLNQKTSNDNPIIKNATPLHLAAYYGQLEATKILLELGANIREKDLDGRTPLHLAVIQGHHAIATLMVAKDKTVPFEKDNLGFIPVTYSNNDELTALLLGTCYDPLYKLVLGYSDKEDEKRALTIVLNHGTIPGITRLEDILELSDFSGNSLLMHAILAGNYNYLKMLSDRKYPFNLSTRNIYGVGPRVYLHWMKNKRILHLFGNCPLVGDEVTQFNHLEQVASESYHNSTILYLGSLPQNRTDTGSCLSSRMEYGIASLNSIIQRPSESKPQSGTWTPTDLSTALAVIEQRTPTNNFEYLTWLAKIMVVTLVASSATSNYSHLSVQEMIAIYLNSAVADLTLYQNEIQTMVTAQSYYNCLYNGIHKLDHFEGEVFVGVSNEFNRSKFLPGTELEVTELLSGTTMWKVATSYLKQYETTKRGTIFLIKSKTSHFTGSYTKFIRDSEVIFLPGTRFIVTALYRGGDCIVLGQENIRDHTYRIKDDELPDYMTTNRSLVIELTEMADLQKMNVEN